MKFIEVIEKEKLECTLEYVRTLSNYWPRSIGLNAAHALNVGGTVFLKLDDDGYADITGQRPVGTELVLSYKKEGWVVDSVQEVNRATMEFQGKHYYVDELEEALAGCEVK